MLRKKKPEKQTAPKPGKNQPQFFAGSSNPADFIAPSVIKETKPGEQSAEGKVTDYWVEIGSTVEPVRYFRSFFAALTGNLTWAGMLDPLYRGEFGEGDCDTVIHIRPADSSRILWEIERKIAALEADIMTENNSSRRSDMMKALSDLHDRQARLRTSGEKAFFVAIQAVASGKKLDSFKRFCNALVKRLAGSNVILKGADTRQLQALLAASPLDQNTINDVYLNMESSNVADLFPFGHGGISHKSGIIIGLDSQGREIFFDNWHPSLDNYHLLILGRAGSGKSVAIKKITYRSALLGIKTAIIDPEEEYKRLTEDAGCPYFRLSAAGGHRINIFDIETDINEDNEQEFVNLDESVAAVKAVVFRMIRQMDDEVLTGSVKVKIEELIRKLYTDRGITEDPNSIYAAVESGFKTEAKRKEMPTLTDLYHEMTTDSELETAARILRLFTQEGGSKSQAIFDGQSTVAIGDYPIIGFSLKSLDEELMRPIGVFVVTKWVWERFGKKNRKQRKRIVIDEAQLLMDHPEEAKWLENAYRRGRKQNISMCAVTQGFEVFARVEEGMGVLKNCPTKILLRQEPVDIQAVKGRFNLSDGEALTLLDAPKGHGILRVDQESTAIYFDLTPREQELFNTDPNIVRKEA